ncbi:MAG: dihydrofolate reductase [Candidatus Omnitrophica bacterium]|nr:dihydrofolate reductase [Candidatus Omnitrophota bacterium]
MTVSLIVAVSRNGVIGNEGKLPWRLPADLKRFKQLTMGHPIIMGRKTFESIGKPLPGRTNIVITRQKNLQACGALVAHSLEEALRLCEKEQEAFVIGGASIYPEALGQADRIYLTEVHADFEGDARFQLDRAGWKEASREDHFDETSGCFYSFIELHKH